ncbi:hypothetical protein C0581_00645 [Candidatus Parcubacteria bacterium]|nr:MAG: hypothetical protein C0581_00645 [Candidatus Parcubacteria bacterium]
MTEFSESSPITAKERYNLIQQEIDDLCLAVFKEDGTFDRALAPILKKVLDAHNMDMGQQLLDELGEVSHRKDEAGEVSIFINCIDITGKEIKETLDFLLSKNALKELKNK